MIKYLKSLSKSIQNNLKSLFKDPSQMRDMFFEVFVYRLLDFNRVENKKRTVWFLSLADTYSIDNVIE